MPTPSLRADGVSFAFGDRVILDDVTMHLTPGWTGLVGANGCGKTTLLRLLAGELSPTSGRLQLPRGRSVLCHQEVEDLHEAVRAFSGAADGVAQRLRGHLALAPASLSRWATLSPGERKRWQIATALHEAPATLLLDEPTNHLDAEAAAVLHSALADYRGVGVLVSHDRALLDAVTTSTLRLDHGHLRLDQGPYSSARAAWTAEEEQALGQQREAQRRLRGEARRLDAARHRLAGATSSRRAGTRMKGPRDSDMRTLGADSRAETAERAHAAAVRRRNAKAAEVQSELDAIIVRDEPGRGLFVRYEPCPKPLVVRFSGDVFLPTPARKTALLHGVVATVRRDEHVVVEGQNGAGKSTLLAALLEAAALPADRVLRLPQELTAEETRSDLATLRTLSDEARGRVLQLVHALGVEPDALLASSRPSPGEGRKLRLALGLGRHAWLAVLDEPTNHLDVPAIERLEAALVEFPGALLLVTHDASLAAKVAATRWRVEGGAVRA